MSLSTQINYNAAAQFSYDASLITFGSGAAKLLISGTYPVSNPAVSTQYNVVVGALTAFSAAVTVAGSDAVQFQLLVNGVCYWWDTVNNLWAAATQAAYAQSNTAAIVNTNCPTLISQLALTAPVYISVVGLLHSASGATTPTLTSVTLSYTFSNASVAAINLNAVTCFLKDVLGNVPTYNTQQPSTLYCKSDRPFLHGNRLVLPFSKSANFDSTGLASLTVIETATPGYPLQFSISYYEQNSRKQVFFRPAIIPNNASQSLTSFAAVDTIDFG